MSATVYLSVVIPVYNEEGNVQTLADEINAALGDEPYTWQCLWVNDGSTDRTLAAITPLTQRDRRHRRLNLAHNAGQSAALSAGFDASRSELIAMMDGDGQNDPADLPKLVRALETGAVQIVNGYRQTRRDHWTRRVASRIANGFRNRVTGHTVRDVGCSARVFRRECVRGLVRFKGMHRFLPTLMAMQGHRMMEVPINHRPRRHGSTKYSIRNRLWVGLFDLFGVYWLKKRALCYKVENDIEPDPGHAS